MGLGLAVGLGLGVRVAVGVAVTVEVGVGLGVPALGTGTETPMSAPVLKKRTVAVPGKGGACASNRKLYRVPQRIAFAFGFCAIVSVFHVI